MGELLRAVGVSRGFPAAGETFWAVKGVDMLVEEKQLVILKGRSGSGKTTLLNILGALDAPTAGDVFFMGKSLNALPKRERDFLRGRSMGFVFQSVALISMMTAYENVEFGLRVAGFGAKERRERAEGCLGLVGLSQRMRHLPNEMSGGECQRVAIARAIAHRPRIVFADEPTAELDTNTGLQVVKIFKDLIEKEGVTVVMTTHDPGLMEIGDRVYELEDGALAGELNRRGGR
ncbi:MAG: ABC transporter ATP-binding protein [Firmicutes bacterium]|nr:ABC transporter ATP-binding protein [Bacillota bacterium]